VLPVRQLRHYYRRFAKASHPEPPPSDEKIIRLNEYRPSAEQEAHRVNIDALLDPVRASREGGRNHTLNRQAFLAGKDIRAGKLAESEIVPLLLAAAKSVGLDEQEAMRTIKSGLRGGGKAVG
jgi:hypothetical protein